MDIDWLTITFLKYIVFKTTPILFSSYASGDDLLADGWAAVEEATDDLRLIIFVDVALTLFL